MNGVVEQLSAWLGGEAGLWLVALSLVLFVGTLLLVPVLIVRLPADYFRAASAPSDAPSRHPLLRALEWVVRNLVGAVLLLAGVAMLVLPGQGLLTILVSLMILDFPGKYQLERWLIERPGVLRAANWIRARKGRPPLEVDRPAASEPGPPSREPSEAD